MTKYTEIITELIKRAPLVVNVTLSDDMGYEISAITHEGVIFPEPGMLAEYDEYELSKILSGRKLGRFLDSLEATPYTDLSFEDLLVLKEAIASGPTF
jgi:hypothetical protein